MRAQKLIFNSFNTIHTKKNTLTNVYTRYITARDATITISNYSTATNLKETKEKQNKKQHAR